jgi:hypothetical protein
MIAPQGSRAPVDPSADSCPLRVHLRLGLVATPRVRHKHLKLDQRKIDFAKRYFGAASEQEAIDRTLSLLMEEARIVRAMKQLAGILAADRRAWPYR